MGTMGHSTITLQLTAGQEHELLPLQKIDDRKALMYPAYWEAARALCGILQSAQRFRSDCERSEQKPDLYSYANNTIAFCGSRGQGKTSAMLSFGNALKAANKLPPELDPDGMIAGSCFYVMDPIDPTMLKKGGHIAEVVLSYLYGQMRELLEAGKGGGLATREREEVLRRFQQSIEWLHSSSGPSNQSNQSGDFYDFEKPGHGFDIKENLYHIVNCFLRLSNGQYSAGRSSFAQRREKALFLVIILDDMDLQLENSYAILEEVRQYLQLPNTIVLMAADIVQLRRTIAMHYCDQMRTALQNDLMVQNEIHRLAAKYMDKLIPAAQTIYLPEYKPSICRGSELRVVFADKDDNCPEKSAELHESFFDLIYRKTSLVFVRHESYVNNLFPATLRGLRQMYRLFDSMPEPCELKPLPASFWEDLNVHDTALCRRKISDGNDKMREYLKQRLERVLQLERNLSVFQTYFLGDWSASRLDYAGERALHRISRSAVPVSFSVALRELKNWCRRAYPDDFEEMCAPAENAEDNLYSALCMLLQRITELGEEPAYLLAFAVHTYFSIQLTGEALREQREKIEGELAIDRNAPQYSKEDICRFGLGYDNLRKRFGSKQFTPAFCEPLENNTGSSAQALLEIYFNYLRRNSSSGGNSGSIIGDDVEKAALIRSWKYWVAQDWAVQFCCNWELQECALKQMKEPVIHKSSSIEMSSLNDKLLEKAPVCSVNDDDWRQIITKDYASFSLRDTAVFPAIREEIHSRQQQNEDIQTGFKLISDAYALASQCKGNSSSAAESSMCTVCNNLHDAVVVLKPYMNRNVAKRMEDICDRIHKEFPLSDESFHQLELLRNRVKRLCEAVPSSDPPADE